MPKIYRLMLMDDGKPKVGSERDCLGVRIYDAADLSRVYDVKPDRRGLVSPGKGGMSVAPTLRDLLTRLPARLVPVHLRPAFPAARGTRSTFVWSMGEGSFVACHITPDLALHPDAVPRPGHGTVEPTHKMGVEGFMNALTVTQPAWRVDEK